MPLEYAIDRVTPEKGPIMEQCDHKNTRLICRRNKDDNHHRCMACGAVFQSGRLITNQRYLRYLGY